MPFESNKLNEMQAFVENYSSGDEVRIRFDWNGKHGAEFVDRNVELRRAVHDAVLADIQSAPLQLVRDLFKAHTEFSRQAWCISRGVNILGERMLRNDAERFIEDYLTGKFQSFDASLGSSFPIDPILANQLLDICERRLKEDLPPDRRNLLEAGYKLFFESLSASVRR